MGWRVATAVALALAIVALAASALQISRAGASSNGTTRTITTQGQGSVNVAPDQASIQVGVNNQGPQLGPVLSSNSKTVQQVISAVTAQGVPSSQIQTNNLNLYYDTQNHVYNLTNTLTVQVNGVNRVSALWQAATAAGANSSWGVTFGVKDPAAARAQALRLALADAQRRGADEAAAVGLTLGAVRSVNVATAGAAPEQVQCTTGCGGGGGPPVQGGQLSVTENVTVTYDAH